MVFAVIHKIIDFEKNFGTSGTKRWQIYQKAIRKSDPKQMEGDINDRRA